MTSVTANYQRLYGLVERVAAQPKDTQALGAIREGFAGKVGERDVYDAIAGYVAQQRGKAGFSADALIQTIAEAVAPTQTKSFADGVATRFAKLQPTQVDPGQFRALADTPATPATNAGLQALAMPIVADGLNYPFSPNHLKTSIEVANYQVDMIAKLEAGNYEAAFESIRNNAVTGNKVLTFDKADIESFCKPLADRLSSQGWKMLQLLGVFHDIARVEPTWAADNGFDMKEVPGVAHDYEAVHLLRNNPQILEKFGLSAEEREMLISLIEWHTIPGQNAFGEGNTAGWRRLLEMSIARGDTMALDIARLHGLVDVMSATAPDLNGTQASKFVKPILMSHVALSKQVDESWARRAEHAPDKNILLTVFREMAAKETSPELTEVGKQFGLSVSSMYRVSKLTGVKDPKVMTSGLAKLDKSFLEAFEKATDTEDTWYGTYLPWNLGSNFIQRTGMPADSVVASLVKVVSASAAYHAEENAGRFAFTTRNLARENPVVLIKTMDDLATLSQALDVFAANAKRNEGLTLTRTRDGVEFIRLFPGGKLADQEIADLRKRNLRQAVYTRIAQAPDFNFTGTKLGERLDALIKKTPDFANFGQGWSVSELSRSADLLNTLDVTRLNEFPGISPAAAEAVGAHRMKNGYPQKNVFGKVADLADVKDANGTRLVSDEAIDAIETQEKLAQVCSANFIGSRELAVKFFSCLEQHLTEAGADDVSFLQHLKNTVATRPMEFRLQGDVVAMNEGSLTRTVDTWPLYNVHFTASAKSEILTNFGIGDWTGFKAAIDRDPSLLREILQPDGTLRRNLFHGDVTGGSGMGWWAPSANLGKLGTAEQVATARGLPLDIYKPGFLFVQMPFEAAAKFEVRKPTPFDAIALREWQPVRDSDEMQAQGAKLGKTIGGVPEVVIKSVPIGGLIINVVYGTKS